MQLNRALRSEHKKDCYKNLTMAIPVAVRGRCTSMGPEWHPDHHGLVRSNRCYGFAGQGHCPYRVASPVLRLRETAHGSVRGTPGEKTRKVYNTRLTQESLQRDRPCSIGHAQNHQDTAYC